jgi:hypothetical protein
MEGSLPVLLQFQFALFGIRKKFKNMQPKTLKSRNLTRRCNGLLLVGSFCAWQATLAQNPPTKSNRRAQRYDHVLTEIHYVHTMYR